MQEALNNVAKHSQADLVQLVLQKTDSAVELTLHDNGMGFDLAEAISLIPSRRGFGLASMRERAQLSGASFDIKSAEREGTTIRVVWQN